ncbi:Com family DNA-binding transcriptional regulator [Halomonas halophila]
MDEIRCTQCNRKLARASRYDRIEIKCPRCGHLNQRATSSRPVPKEAPRGYPDHSLDGRQAPSR